MIQFWKERLHRVGKATKDGFWALLSPFIILGGIYSGFFTPTEAAAVSVVYSIIVSLFVYHDMTWKDLYKTLCPPLSSTALLPSCWAPPQCSPPS